jgi:Na+-transporting methylmalonyl-CoA/oxaloacetate decarboxylase gamma subunit
MTDLLLSLQITALGMGLVFGAILLLWLMMILLTSFTAAKTTQADEATASDSPQPDAERVPQAGFKAQAAALAVAIALAEQGQSTAHPLTEPPTAIVSAWQLGMRTSQRTQKGNFRRR